MKTAKGVGVYRITVTRVWHGRDVSKSRHEVDIAAGNWIAALEEAANDPGHNFDYVCQPQEASESER